MAPASPRNAARERAAASRLAQRKAQRRRRALLWTGSGGAVVLAIVVVIVVVLTGGGGSSSTSSAPPTASSSSAPVALGPEGIPNEVGTALASATSAAGGRSVDGIACEASEQVAYHIHAHLAVYVDGGLRPIPLGIGIVKPVVQQTATGGFASATTCYYWLHTHVQDGVIHIESPTRATYTLGQFFDEWNQPLSSSQVAAATGLVTAYVNGTRYAGDPRNIPLLAHAVIQLDVGSPAVAPVAVNWSTSSL